MDLWTLKTLVFNIQALLLGKLPDLSAYLIIIYHLKYAKPKKTHSKSKNPQITH